VYALAAGVAFLLELAALAALGYWGRATGGGAWPVVLAIATPLAAALLWGTVASPRAPVRLPTAPKLAVRLAVLLGAAVALAVAGQPTLALLLAVTVVADQAVLVALGRPVAGASG
jgi:Protein of unknown function (DUF2568)